jgi:AcrR family transcriptional regulator
MSSPRLSADARRQQILDVAIQEFGRTGYFGTSMNDIAEAAGVTKPVLYQHFDSKADLYRALLDEVGTRMLEAIAKATSDAHDGRERTERGFGAYFRWVADHHQEFTLLFGGSARQEGEFSAQIRRINEAAASAIAGLIDIDIDPEHRETIAHGLVGLAEGASRRLVGLGQSFDPDEIARVVSQLAWAGLRAIDRDPR